MTEVSFETKSAAVKTAVTERKVSVILFYNKKGEILLQRRSGKVSKSGEEWGFFGGGIDEGETPERTIKREIKEELDYNLQKFELIGTHENIYYNGKQKALRKLHRTIFATPVNDEILKAKVLEGDGAHLFPLEKAKCLKLVPGDEKVLEKFEKFFNRLR